MSGLRRDDRVIVSDPVTERDVRGVVTSDEHDGRVTVLLDNGQRHTFARYFVAAVLPGTENQP